MHQPVTPLKSMVESTSSNKHLLAYSVRVQEGKGRGVDTLPADLDFIVSMTNCKFLEDRSELLVKGYMPCSLLSIDFCGDSLDDLPEDYEYCVIWLKRVQRSPPSLHPNTIQMLKSPGTVVPENHLKTLLYI